MSRGMIWIDLAPGVSMEIDQRVALLLDRRSFARLYRRHVFGATRREARAWADRQIALRDRVVAAQAELAAR